MLSQYLKEQRNIGDFTGGMAAKFEAKSSPEATMNLMPKNEIFENLRSKDFFQRRSGSMEFLNDYFSSGFRKLETAEATQIAPLTIFFARKMIVFNDFPADKAKEIMNLASQGRSRIFTGSVSDSELSAEKLNLNKFESQIPDLNIASAFESSQHAFDQNKSIGADLPIANSNNDDENCEIVELDAVELLAEHIHFCEICGKGFKRDANLRMHMRAHGNQYKTPEALAKKGRTKFEVSAASSGRKTRFACPFDDCNRNQKHKRFRPLKSVISVRNHFKRSCKTRRQHRLSDVAVGRGGGRGDSRERV